MGNEEEIREFRKRLLKQLLLRLTQDVGEPFNTLAELNEFEPKLSEEDDDHTKLQTLISRYKDLLELATSKASSSGNLPSLKNINDPLAQTGMPLPPYDEVTLTTGPEDIRLLQLLPGTYDEPIVCNLFQIDSLTLYEYEALSYVWGPNENPSVIYVNDWQLAVTKNLEMALRSLRDENNSRILWIDAICIDQTSILEKTEQVGRMGDIYKAAKKVLVFLGPESETSDSVFQFFEKVYNQLPEYGGSEYTGLLCRLDTAALLVEHHLPIVQAFVELLFRPWFSRIWVRQEYIRAAEVPRLICGRRSIDFPKRAFDCLCGAVFLLPTLLKHPMSEILRPRRFHEVYSRAISVFHTMSAANNYPERVDEWLCNEGVTGCEATDSRDLIFSVCALFDDVAAAVLSAEYSQSTEDVFMRASAWVLMMEQSPKMLVHYPPLEDESIPSWVLDFRKARPTSRHHEFVATFNYDVFDDKKEEDDQDEGHDEAKSEDGNEAEDGGHRSMTEDDISSEYNLQDALGGELEAQGAKSGNDGQVAPDTLGEMTSDPNMIEGRQDSQDEGGQVPRGNECHEEPEEHERHKEQELTDPPEENQNPEDQPVDEVESAGPPPKIHCSIYQQILSIPGVEFDIISEVHEFSSQDRIEAVRNLWHLEKQFQSIDGIAEPDNYDLILEWAVKVPINHMVSMLVPRSEYYLEFLEAELEEFVAGLASALLEDLLGALLFDFERLDSELRFVLGVELDTEDDTMALMKELTHLYIPAYRYSTLVSSLLSTSEEQNMDLLSLLQTLATKTLPSLLSQPDPPKSPRPSGASTPSSSSSSSASTLHSLPQTRSDLLQAWENEREDIFSQLFTSCCFFRTTVGFPGLGAFGLRGLKAGDVVVWLDGVPMPMVLRICEDKDTDRRRKRERRVDWDDWDEESNEEEDKEDDEEELWKLIGPVVVRGIMDGDLGRWFDGPLEKDVYKIV